MKKSTLITTIAMIVVVVVALSTATYAWFTSGTVATANVTMTTTATADFSLTVVPNVTSSTSWASGQTGIGLQLTAHSGLWAPEAAISNGLAYTASTITPLTNNFYSADYKNNTTAQQNSASTPWGFDAIRVTNITDSEKDLYMYIVVAIDYDEASANNLYAAQALSSVVKVAAEEEDIVTYTTGYGLGSKSSVAEFTVGTELTKAAGVNAQGFTELTLGDVTTKTARPAYDGLTTDFKKCGAKEELGIADDQLVIIYGAKLLGATTKLGSQKSITISAYTWIDGWTADNAAGNANFTVTYAFAKDLPSVSLAS